jgi:phosphoglucosamine mutase
VPVADRAIARSPDIVAAVADAEANLGDRGRILVRPSGTESLVRVMVEAEDEATTRTVAEAVASIIRSVAQSAA